MLIKKYHQQQECLTKRRVALKESQQEARLSKTEEGQ